MLQHRHQHIALQRCRYAAAAALRFEIVNGETMWLSACAMAASYGMWRNVTAANGYKAFCLSKLASCDEALAKSINAIITTENNNIYNNISSMAK